MTFGERLRSTLDARGHLCVGIDPHAFLLAEWSLTDDASGVRDFGLRVVEAASDRVGIVKPQVAFFERHGSAGLAALEDVLAAARAAGLLVIADAKRGDIGSTFDAYAEAWLGRGGALASDAMTVSTYLGAGSVAGPRDIALANDAGLFVLAATSNPEGKPVQTAVTPSGQTVAGSIVEKVHEWNAGETGFGSIGLVLGATLDLEAYGIDRAHLVNTPILAPGFGHQGARIADLRALYGDAASNVLVSASRSILAAGPTGIADAITAQAVEVAEAVAA